MKNIQRILHCRESYAQYKTNNKQLGFWQKCKALYALIQTSFLFLEQCLAVIKLNMKKEKGWILITVTKNINSSLSL